MRVVIGDLFMKMALLIAWLPCIFLFIPLHAEYKPTLDEILSNEQDMHNSDRETALKGFVSFIFFGMVPASTKELSDKLNRQIEKELKKYGNVTPLKLLVKTEKGDVVDLSEFSSGNCLIYTIKNVDLLDGKNPRIVRASLRDCR